MVNEYLDAADNTIAKNREELKSELGLQNKSTDPNANNNTMHNNCHGGHCHHEIKVPIKRGEKIGRNEACSCGSGKKYKKCCLLV
jgi:uncharacterized protein YchJ